MRCKWCGDRLIASPEGAYLHTSGRYSWDQDGMRQLALATMRWANHTAEPEDDIPSIWREAWYWNKKWE